MARVVKLVFLDDGEGQTFVDHVERQMGVIREDGDYYDCDVIVLESYPDDEYVPEPVATTKKATKK